MPKPTAIVYIDGFNLYYGALRDSEYKWLNLEAFARALVPRNHVVRVRYFTARIKPRPDDPQAPARQQAYLRALSSLEHCVSVHEGQFFVSNVRMALADPAARPRTVEVIKSEEKGSDVNLATYLVRDALLSEADAFIVVSNDSDLTEPMRLVKQEARRIVGLISPYERQSRALLKCTPDFAKVVRAHHLEAAQFPDVVELPDGTQVWKPDSWEMQEKAESPCEGPRSR